MSESFFFTNNLMYSRRVVFLASVPPKLPLSLPEVQAISADKLLKLLSEIAMHSLQRWAENYSVPSLALDQRDRGWGKWFRLLSCHKRTRRMLVQISNLHHNRPWKWFVKAGNLLRWDRIRADDISWRRETSPNSDSSQGMSLSLIHDRLRSNWSKVHRKHNEYVKWLQYPRRCLSCYETLFHPWTARGECYSF